MLNWSNIFGSELNPDLMIATGIAAAVISLAGCCLAWFFGRRPAIKHGILFSALAGLLLCPAFALLNQRLHISLLQIPVTLPANMLDVSLQVRRATLNQTNRRSTAVENSRLIASDRQAASPTNARPPITLNSGRSDDGSSIGSETSTDAIVTDLAGNSRSDRPILEADASQSHFRGWQIVPTLAVIWLVGTIVFAVRFIRVFVLHRKLRRSLRPAEPSAISGILKTVTTQMTSQKLPPVMVSSLVHTPLVLGIFRPAIVLPERLLDQLTPDELADILMHERAHVLRRDNLLIMLHSIAAAFYWPIPMVHLLGRQMEQAREDICDNHVLKMRDELSYGHTLLKLAELACDRRVPAAAGIFQWRGKLESRIARLIHARRDKVTCIHPLIFAVILSLFILASGCMSGVSTRPSATTQQSNVVQKNLKPTTMPNFGEDFADAQNADHYFGYVFGSDGKPLEDAKIYLVQYKTEEKPTVVRALTDANGLFEFRAPDMTYTGFDGLRSRREGLLIAMKDGYGPDSMQTWGHHSTQGSHTDPFKGAKMNFRLPLADMDFHGRLLSPDGKPLAGASVKVTCLMTVEKDDLDSFLKALSEAEGVGGGFLSSGPSLEKDMYEVQRFPELNLRATTDANGHFKFSGLGRGRVLDLVAEAPGIVKTSFRAMVRNEPIPTTKPASIKNASGDDEPQSWWIHNSGFTLKTTPGLIIKGVVIDKETRQPVANMWVGPLSNIVNKFDQATYPWRTDAQGRFTLTGLASYHLTSESEHNHIIVAATTPGLPYETGWSLIKKAADGKAADMTIEVQRGISFHLKLLDEAGKPVEAEVTYMDVANKYEQRDEVIYPVSVARHNSDGTYSGFVKAGPGAILVKTHWSELFRPAKVDAKAFFAPGKTDWTEKEKEYSYGNAAELYTPNGIYLNVLWRDRRISQNDYTAIILVNPPADSKPLELSAAMTKYKTRKVYLYDADGKPLTGVEASFNNRGNDLLRSSNFDLTDLSLDQHLQVKFTKSETDIVGLLITREVGPPSVITNPSNIKTPDNDPTSIAVQLVKPAYITGRVVDEMGKPLTGRTIGFDLLGTKVYTYGGESQEGGRFSTSTVFPGATYRMSGIFYQQRRLQLGDNHIPDLILKPGETRDIGDVIVKPVSVEE